MSKYYGGPQGNYGNYRQPNPHYSNGHGQPGYGGHQQYWAPQYPPANQYPHPSAAYGQNPNYGYPGYGAPNGGMTEEMVRSQLEAKEAEIQALRNQLQQMDNPQGVQQYAPQQGYVPYNGGYQMTAADYDEMDQFLDEFDNDVQAQLKAEEEQGVKSGYNPDGTKANLEGEEEEAPEEPDDEDAEYLEFIRQDQAADAKNAASEVAKSAEEDTSKSAEEGKA